MYLPKEDFCKAKYVETATELAKFVEEKDTMYGNAAFNMINEYGMDYALSKMEEKLYRLKQLKRLNKMNHSESFKDSVKDLMGYALLTILYIEGSEDWDLRNKPEIMENVCNSEEDDIEVPARDIDLKEDMDKMISKMRRNYDLTEREV